jgi:hypothetical protein
VKQKEIAEATKQPVGSLKEKESYGRRHTEQQ